MTRAQIIKWHRRLGWLAGLAILLWGLSGLIHPLMTWTNPRPVSFSPVVAEDFTPPSVTRIKAVLRQNNLTEVSGLRLYKDGNNVMLQVRTQGNPETVHINSRSGFVLPDADRNRAIAIARHYTGVTESAVKSATLITSFSQEYPYINRYLPAWKIVFDRPDEKTAYVETDTGRLGSITDRRKIILQALFQSIHLGQFLDGMEWLRLVVIGGLVFTILPMAVMGVLMLRTGGVRKGARLWHRMLAFIIWLPLFMFPASGLFHLVMKSPLVYQEEQPAAMTLSIDALDFMPPLYPVRDLRLVFAQDGRAWWRAEQDVHAVYRRLQDGAILYNDEDFIRDLTGDETGLLTEIKSFTNEYGFAFKRLPVWRVEASDHILFMEARTGTVAARVAAADIAETWSFGTLHKWQFLDPFSKWIMGGGSFGHAVRDVIMVFFVLCALSGTTAGGFLLFKRRKS